MHLITEGARDANAGSSPTPDPLLSFGVSSTVDIWDWIILCCEGLSCALEDA